MIGEVVSFMWMLSEDMASFLTYFAALNLCAKSVTMDRLLLVGLMAVPLGMVEKDLLDGKCKNSVRLNGFPVKDPHLCFYDWKRTLCRRLMSDVDRLSDSINSAKLRGVHRTSNHDNDHFLQYRTS